MADAKIGVVLLNMGGPDSLDDVPKYLLNIFHDPDILDMPLGFLVRPWLSRRIVKKRAAASAERYRQIGGKTPLNAIAEKQAKVIQDALVKMEVPSVVVPGMRYWHPFTEEAIKQFVREKVELVVALSMYPAYSNATSGSSFKNFRYIMKRHLPGVPFTQIVQWPNLPAYVEFMRENVTTSLQSIGSDAWPKTAVLFSGHSVPVKRIKRGDPYQKQMEETYRLVCERLPREVKTVLGWQSAFGPAKWLEPDSKSLVSAIRAEGMEHLVVVPLGFVAENSETLWDIEIDLKTFALEQGFRQFVRIACPNEDGAVMRGLAELIAAAIGENSHGD
ncbi:MAG TPA: ferrochelatase [Candidatus Hydrogenedentes bacterium]|nr:ferrochelatase [Candidatus Hydrogenedentota bacterium]